MSNRIFNLKKSDALIRTNSNISNIQYNCYLNLKNNEKNVYYGIIEIKFDVEKIEKIFVDYCGDKIKKLNINGKDVELSEEYLKNNWINSNLYLPNNLIQNKDNLVEIEFSNTLSSDGDGLCLTYGVDKLKYKYTQTEPYGLNRIFPAFDQPDLKGKIKFYFTTSDEEEVVTTEFYEKYYKTFNEIKLEELDSFGKKLYNLYKNDLSNLWVFDNSKSISSYLFGFSVGPFIEYKLDLKKFERGIPISIYCRKSMAKFMDDQIENIYFAMTNGILLYEEFFGIDYPFSKNDLIFLPEYKVGAMEYPGCITINEKLIFEDNVIPPMKKLSRSHVIYHELAHMWFGNLVTMKWWDDLWLNESFAELVSVMMMKNVNDPANTINFDTDIILRTDWGLKTDEKISTHPISCNIIDTLMAESIFDGISYSKGPGVLKQLVYNIGLDKFKENLKNYFRKYQWKNTDLKMFLEEMGNGLDFNMTEFNEDFIQTSCLNRLILERKEDGINIIQTYVLKEFNYLRNHKIMIKFFDENCEIIKTVDFWIKKQENNFLKLDKELLNKSKAIFINYNFYAWVRFNLDDQSNDFVLKNIQKFKNYSLNLRIFFSNYYNLVRESKLKSTVYLDNIINILDDIIDDQAMISEVLPTCLGSIHFYMPNNLKKENCIKLNDKLFELLVKESNPIMSKKLFDYYLETCMTNQSILSLKIFLDQEFSNKNLKLIINDKWSIYFNLMASGLMDNEFEKKYFEKLEKEDKSDAIKNYKIKIKGFKANEEERKDLIEVYKDGKSNILNYKEKLFSIEGFKSHYLEEKVRYDYYDKYFENIIYVFRNFGLRNGGYFLDYLNPRHYRLEENISRLENILKDLKEDEESFKRYISSCREDLIRIQKHLELYN